MAMPSGMSISGLRAVTTLTSPVATETGTAQTVVAETAASATPRRRRCFFMICARIDVRLKDKGRSAVDRVPESLGVRKIWYPIAPGITLYRGEVPAVVSALTDQRGFVERLFAEH